MNTPALAGQMLASRHREQTRADPTHSVLNYAESPRCGDWTLRSALVRLAQPEPTRSGAILQLVRRCDGALQPMVRALQAKTVTCDRGLTMHDLLRSAQDPTQDTAVTSPRYPDARIVDVARLALDSPEHIAAIVESYDQERALSEVEREAMQLVEIALRLDLLGQLVADWASGPADRATPISQVDGICTDVFARLESIGVPLEQGPPRGRGRR